MPDDYADDLRVEVPSRACDACRKMKIKCIDKENPPCKRCRHMKLQCRFAMAPVPRVVLEEQEATKGRLEQLEGHVSGIYQKLDEMSSMLVRLAGGGGGPVAAATPSIPSVGASTSVSTNLSPRVDSNTRDDGGIPNGPPIARPASVASAPSAIESSLRNEHPLRMRTDSTGTSADTPWSRDYLPQGGGGILAEPIPLGPPQLSVLSGGIAPEPQSLMDDDDEDPREENAYQYFPGRGEPRPHLPTAEAGFTWDSMDAGTPAGAKRASSQNGGTDSPAKRRRTYPLDSIDEFEIEPTSGAAREKRGLGQWPDPVDRGLVSEEEGKRLFNAYFKYAHPFTPVLDPREDTWEKLRKRSPFCITVILLVALRQREKQTQPSELSDLVQEQVERMARLTLFSHRTTIETVQALAILISHTQNAWRTCCHAMALAVDMRLYRCLPYLHKIRTDSQKPHHMLDRQRPLVVGARLWLSLVCSAYEMSFKLALPILFAGQGGKRTLHARELLDHPLSTLYDSRIVLSVELYEVRETAFLPLDSLASQSQAELNTLMRKANQGVQELYEYWSQYYERVGLAPTDFLRLELDHLRAFAILFINASAWYGVHTKEDVSLLSSERQQWITGAMQSAAFLVTSFAHQRLDRDSEFGTHNFYAGIVSTARYLVRMAELLPDACDLHKISLDIDRLVLKLPHYSAGAFMHGLRRTLAKARRSGTLPYTAMSEAAAQATARSSPLARSPASADGMAQFPGLNPFPWNDPVQTLNDMTSGGGGSGLSPYSNPLTDTMVAVPNLDEPTRALPDIQWPGNLDLLAWFPASDSAQVDHAALDADLGNWFPAAPQVWFEDS